MCKVPILSLIPCVKYAFVACDQHDLQRVLRNSYYVKLSVDCLSELSVAAMSLECFYCIKPGTPVSCNTYDISCVGCLSLAHIASLFKFTLATFTCSAVLLC